MIFSAIKKGLVSKTPFLLGFAVVLLFSSFVCLYNLGHGSMGSDEAQHTLVTQNMLKKGAYWDLNNGRQPYYGKPPFKMWLSSVVVRTLGQSKFTFRLLDGLFGVGTALLVYLLAIVMFRSPLAGTLSALALMGSETYLLRHIVRMAVQDSILIFLFTFAMCVAWALLGQVSGSHKQYKFISWSPRTLSILLGISVGLAAFCKTIAAYLILIVLAVYALSSGELKLFSRRWGLALIVVFLSLAIPAPYWIFRCVESSEMCRGVLAIGGVEHALEIARSDRWKFVRTLFVDRVVIPPEFLVIALGFTGWLAIRKNDRRFLYLIVWAVTPYVFYTAMDGKWSWYTAPAFPAMALLVGATIGYAIRQVRIIKYRGMKRFFFQGALVCFIAAGTLQLAHWYVRVAQAVTFDQFEIQTDKVVDSILKVMRHNPEAKVLFTADPFPMRERVYINMIKSFSDRISRTPHLTEVSDPSFKFAFVTEEKFPKLLALRKPIAYTYLEEFDARTQRIVVAAFDSYPPGKSFHPRVKQILIGPRDAPILYGWTESHRLGDFHVRWTIGDAAGLIIEADSAHRAFGGEITVTCAVPNPDIKGVYVIPKINGQSVGKFTVTRKALQTYTFHIDPKYFRTGKNVLEFAVENQTDPKHFSEAQRVLLVESIDVAVAMPEPAVTAESAISR